MAIETILATLLGAALAALKPEEVVKSIVGGIVGNRADALFVKGYEAARSSFAQPYDPIVSNPVLAKAIYRSFLLACRSAAIECRTELLGDAPEMYRGRLVLPGGHEASIYWLEEKLDALQKSLKELDRVNVEVQLPSLWTVSETAMLDTRSAQDITQAVQHQLCQEALTEGAIGLYQAKLQQEKGGLFDRMCAFFAFELNRNSELKTFFETHLLIRMQQELGIQNIALRDLADGLYLVAEAVPQVLAKLEDLERTIEVRQYELGQGIGTVLLAVNDNADGIERIEELLRERLLQLQPESASLSLQPLDVTRTLPPNPFNHFNGRVLNPNQLFVPKREIEAICEILNCSGGVALIGKQATGKSSLLKILEQNAEQYLHSSRRAIYLDLKLVQNESEFFEAFCYLAEISHTRKGYELERSLAEKKLLLLLDEVEKMTWDGFTRDIRGQLRGFAESGVLKLVVTARTSLDQLFPDSGGISPFVGVCLEHRLTQWKQPTIQEFIATRLENTPLQFTEMEIEALSQDSQGHPQKLMLACYRLYERYRKGEL